MKDYQQEYSRWLECVNDAELLEELRKMDAAAIEDAFYRNLEFGTGGLRGIIGAGTNRMNTVVVKRASQGLSAYLRRTSGGDVGVVIGYDSRIKSELFAKAAASVFAANGIRVYIWPELLPVPTVSFAVRQLGASAGVMITASHNPSSYNGYKVYGSDGCQITTEAAAEIMNEINRVDPFLGVKAASFPVVRADGRVRDIPPEVLSTYIEQVKRQSVLFGEEIDKNVEIVYSPLNGTGLVPVMRSLSESGFDRITVVEEQRRPDGRFPTCPYPNPEIREAMELGMAYCVKKNAELFLATDPDCDRCGIAVKCPEGYRLFTGNEVGVLLLDYICSQRKKHGRMPDRPVFIKTIVTTDLAEKIAAHYGVETVNVLTGFKFIGEEIGRLEAQGRGEDFICAFEESYGYLTGTYVRDKDAVDAAFMICEMFAYYRTRGISFSEKLEELYRTYGYCLNTLCSYTFEGSAGSEKMKGIMARFRKGVRELGGDAILQTEDYRGGRNGLPPADVLKLCTKNASIVIRPSGTEPKLKAYLSVTALDMTEAKAIEERIRTALSTHMK